MVSGGIREGHKTASQFVGGGIREGHKTASQFVSSGIREGHKTASRFVRGVIRECHQINSCLCLIYIFHLCMYIAHLEYSYRLTNLAVI